MTIRRTYSQRRQNQAAKKIQQFMRKTHLRLVWTSKELYRNGGLTILCYVPHEICWGIFSPASWSSVFLLAGLVTERSARSLRIADRQAWPIRPKFGLDTEPKSSPPFLYSSLRQEHSCAYSPITGGKRASASSASSEAMLGLESIFALSLLRNSSKCDLMWRCDADLKAAVHESRSA